MQASHSVVWFVCRMEIKFFKGANVAFLNKKIGNKTIFSE